jgi:hypothetical protein
MMTPAQSNFIDGRIDCIILSLGDINPHSMLRQDYIDICYPSIECFFTNSTKREIVSMCSYVLYKHKKLTKKNDNQFNQ